jgi:hypothetical protein
MVDATRYEVAFAGRSITVTVARLTAPSDVPQMF